MQKCKVIYEHANCKINVVFVASNYANEPNLPNGKNGEPIRRKLSTLTSLSSQENGLNNPFVMLCCFSSTMVMTVKSSTKVSCHSLRTFSLSSSFNLLLQCVRRTGLQKLALIPRRKIIYGSIFFDILGQPLGKLIFKRVI